MALFRTMQRLIPWFVGLFLVAQLAGVVPRPVYAQPDAKTVASQVHNQQAHNHADHGRSDHNKTQAHHPGDQHGNIADQCCALHLLTGVILPVEMAVPVGRLAQSILQESATAISGIDANPLDRPPRSLLSL
jgi:hypothetical protein